MCFVLNNASTTSISVIDIINCSIALWALVISLRQVWLERFKLKIDFFENENLFFDKLECYKDHKTKLQGIIRVRFVNRSALPVTIFSMKLFIDNTPVSTRVFEKESFTLTTYLHADGSYEYAQFPMKQQISIPLRIDSYDAVEGYVFIPFYPDTDKASQSVKLRIETAKGSRTERSRIWIFQTLFDDGDGPYYE